MAGHSEWELLKTGLRAAAATLSRRQTRRLLGLWTCLLCLGWLLSAIVIIQVPSCVFQSKMVKCRENLHAVQLALERFAVDSPGGVYPADLTVLIDQGYLEQMPLNPFTGEPMRWVMLRESVYEAERPPGLSHGDFGYYPRLEKQYMTEPLDLSILERVEIWGYTLYLY
jgi:hypothetical protein